MSLPLQKNQSEMQYIPKYVATDKPRPSQFQPGINFSLKQEVDKNRYNNNRTELEEAFHNDYANFKRASEVVNSNQDIVSYKGLQAFPMRKDEPPSFAKRMEDGLKRNSNVSTDNNNYLYNEANQITSPKKLENSASSSMLARVGS